MDEETKGMLLTAIEDLFLQARQRDATAERADAQAAAEAARGHGTSAEIIRDRAAWERKEASRLRAQAEKAKVTLAAAAA